MTLSNAYFCLVFPQYFGHRFFVLLFWKTFVKNYQDIIVDSHCFFNWSTPSLLLKYLGQSLFDFLYFPSLYYYFGQSLLPSPELLRKSKILLKNCPRPLFRSLLFFFLSPFLFSHLKSRLMIKSIKWSERFSESCVATLHEISCLTSSLHTM